jgi:hypothetical protein
MELSLSVKYPFIVTGRRVRTVLYSHLRERGRDGVGWLR